MNRLDRVKFLFFDFVGLVGLLVMFVGFYVWLGLGFALIIVGLFMIILSIHIQEEIKRKKLMSHGDKIHRGVMEEILDE